MLSEVRLPGVPTAIDLHLMPDWRVFGLTVIVVLGSTMVSSLGPALRISSGLSIVKTLKTDSRASTWRRYPHSNAGRSFALTPLSEASIHPVVSKALARFGAAGVLAVALLLLLVCAVNVAHLVLARAVDGQREVAIRLAVGANRWRIIRPLLAEGILLTGVAAAIALLLTTTPAAGAYPAWRATRTNLMRSLQAG